MVTCLGVVLRSELNAHLHQLTFRQHRPNVKFAVMLCICIKVLVLFCCQENLPKIVDEILDMLPGEPGDED